MGEVWRARDTRLGRDVALKVLPAAFTSDPERLARFEREAKVLASLNHPNIGGIHGIEEAHGVKALVLELVEGPTLADRIASGPIPIDEALPIAGQIADALDTAHEQGVIHRDLKPANIKVRPDGTVKVLDFGLAKALQPQSQAAVGADLSHSLTLTLGAAATQMGVILGTAAYMAPEQARGRPVDKRADIWAFGCVLYEMLTGRPPFARETSSDTIAAILTQEPDWSALSASTPAPLVSLLRRCMTKDPRARLRDVGDARFEIERAGLPHGENLTAEVSGVGRRLLLAAVLLTGIAVGAVAVWVGRGADATPPARTPIRFSVEMPSGVMIHYAQAAVSSEGGSIAVTAARAGERSRIWVRGMDDAEARPVGGTEGALSPFWSPDGEWIAFFQDGWMKRVRVAGGPAETICEAAGLAGLGGTWNTDDVILFSTSLTSGIQRVDASGGRPTALSTPDAAADEQAHLWPRFLPDGRRFAYTVMYRGDARRSAAIGSLEGMVPTALFAADATPVLSPGGTAAFTRGNTIFTQRVDFESLEPIGDRSCSPATWRRSADGLSMALPPRWPGAPRCAVPHWLGSTAPEDVWLPSDPAFDCNTRRSLRTAAGSPSNG
jgi:hypothetical protein